METPQGQDCLALLIFQDIAIVPLMLLAPILSGASESPLNSLSLGAFIAGLIISESEYSHQTLENIKPFKDIFTLFLFISIGMVLNVGIRK